MADTTRGWMRVIADAVDPGNPGMRNDNEPGYLERIAAGIASLSPATPQPTMAEIAAGVAPMLIATTPPKGETTAAVAGMTTKAQGADHQHPRLTSTTYATLDSNGRATITFTRSFLNKPGFSITEIDTSKTQPLVCVIESFVQPGGAGTPYTGCVVKGYRSQALPAQPAPLNVLALLGTAIGGINTLLSSLTGFNVFGGSPADATISVVAIARSDVSAA